MGKKIMLYEEHKAAQLVKEGYMKCAYCGRRTPDDDTTCEHCGREALGESKEASVT